MSVSDSADDPVSLHSPRGELVKCTLCMYTTHTLSDAFTGNKVIPHSVSDSADVPVALRSSKGELIKSMYCNHTLSDALTGKKMTLIQSQTVLMTQLLSAH